MVPPSRLPTRTVVGFVRRPLTAVVGVVSVLATLVFFGGGRVRGIESALWIVQPENPSHLRMSSRRAAIRTTDRSPERFACRRQILGKSSSGSTRS